YRRLALDIRQCQSRRRKAVFCGVWQHVGGVINFQVLNRYLRSIVSERSRDTLPRRVAMFTFANCELSHNTEPNHQHIPCRLAGGRPVSAPVGISGWDADMIIGGPLPPPPQKTFF